MTPSEDREKAALPIEAEPLALHLRLNAVETASKEILRRIVRSHRALKKEISAGFKQCSESRPCAKPTGTQSPTVTPQGFDFSAWQKVVAGLVVLGSLIGGFVLGPGKSEPQKTPSVSQPVTSQHLPAHP